MTLSSIVLLVLTVLCWFNGFVLFNHYFLLKKVFFFSNQSIAPRCLQLSAGLLCKLIINFDDAADIKQTVKYTIISLSRDPSKNKSWFRKKGIATNRVKSLRDPKRLPRPTTLCADLISIPSQGLSNFLLLGERGSSCCISLRFLEWEWNELQK